MYAYVPFNFLKMGPIYLLSKKHINILAPSRPAIGVKKITHAKEYSILTIKAKCKILGGVTINEFLISIISMTVKAYFLSKGDDKT